MANKKKFSKVIFVLVLITILAFSTTLLKKHKGEASNHTTIKETSKIITIKDTKYVKLPTGQKALLDSLIEYVFIAK